MLLREDDVQAFLAALMTKPFAILTGLSAPAKRSWRSDWVNGSAPIATAARDISSFQ